VFGLPIGPRLCVREPPQVNVSAVFDGHGGPDGAVAAQTAAEVLQRTLSSHDPECDGWSREVWTGHLPNWFTLMHHTIRERMLTTSESATGSASGRRRTVDAQGVVRDSDDECVHGGTTCTVVVQSSDSQGHRFLVTANVGDSEAYLIRTNGEHVLLSAEHKPTSHAEWLRVQSLPQPRKMRFVYDTNLRDKAVFLEDGTRDPKYVSDPWSNGLHPSNVRYEPGSYCVYRSPWGEPDVSTILAMTRSLGDFYAHCVGVTHTPSVGVTDLTDDDVDAIVCVASDGVWDVWLYQDFAATVSAARTAGTLTVDELMAESMAKAKASFGQNHDDSTLIVLRVPPHVPVARSTSARTANESILVATPTAAAQFYRASDSSSGDVLVASPVATVDHVRAELDFATHHRYADVELQGMLWTPFAPSPACSMQTTCSDGDIDAELECGAWPVLTRAHTTTAGLSPLVPA
jgi:serine/threonine protein phosphatase PrpC